MLRKKEKNSQHNGEKMGKCYHIYDRAKMIIQNLYVIKNRKENCVFTPDGVIVPSSKMIFFSRLFWTGFRLVRIKEQRFPCHRLSAWVGKNELQH